MTTFQKVSPDKFRSEAAIFFRATQDRQSLTHEQADNGHKALTLLYFGQDENWTEVEINSAVLTLELAAKRCFEVAMASPEEGRADE